LLAALAVGALAVGASGCRSSAERESQWLRKSFGPMIRQARNAQTGILDLRERMRFDWDRLIVLPPYSSAEALKSKLGFEWPAGQKSNSQMSDRYSMLVFVKGQEVAAWTDVDRERTSLDPLMDKGYIARADAVFTMRAARRKVELELRPASDR
jgi:hypothetical protein